MEFQQRLYELRKQSGLSQEGLASLLGVTRQAVQKWESGSSRPDMDNLAALARYFNVSLDYLVTGEERSAPPPAATIINNYYSRWHYEYKSPQTFFGLPLIHIRLGERGLEICEIAPGIDLRRDILDLLDFDAAVAEDLKTMDLSFAEARQNDAG